MSSTATPNQERDPSTGRSTERNLWQDLSKVPGATKQLEELTQDIQTKKRLLATLSKQTSNFPAALQKEIQSRDIYITQLNTQLVETKATIKDQKAMTIRSKDQEIDRLANENATANKEKSKLNEKIHELQQTVEVEGQKAEEDKNNQLMIQEGLQDELEEAKAQLNLKNDQMEDTKGDMTQLAKIVQDMTALNNELNQKVSSMNSEMEKVNSDMFQCKLKAEHTENIEKDLVEATDDNSNLSRQLKRQQQIIDVLKKDKEETLAAFQESDSKMKSIEQAVEQLDGDLSRQLTDVRHQFKMTAGREFDEELKANTEIEEGQEDAMVKLTTANAELRKVQTDLKTYQGRIAELESTLNNQKTEIKDSERRMSVRATQIAEENERLRNKITGLQEAYAKQAKEMRQIENNAAQSVQQYTALQKKEKQQLAKIRNYEEQIRDLKNNIIKLQTERTNREREIGARERRIKKTASMLKSYEEELYSRDTVILKKTNELNTLTTQNEQVRVQNMNLNVNMKGIVGNELHNANRRIRDLEGEVQLLKEMIRSSQHQMKSVEIGMQKTGTGSPVPEGKTPAGNGKINALYAAVQDFIAAGEELSQWKAEKQKELSSLNIKEIDLAQLKTLFETNVTNKALQDPSEALEKLVRDKAQKLVSGIVRSLRGFKKKVIVEDLLAHVNSPRLQELISSRVDMTVTDLAMVLPHLINQF